MSDDRRHSGNGSCHWSTKGCRQQHARRALGGIEDRHDDSCREASRSQHIGGTGIPAADLPRIDPACKPREDEGKWHRPDEIRGEHDQEESHDVSRPVANRV
jgi:hypothetical protein